MQAQSLSLASTIHDHPLIYPQATLTTMQQTQREMEWLQLLYSRPALMATDVQQTELMLATVPLDMQKWMVMVLNLSEMTVVPRAATFPRPAVISSLVAGNVSAPPSNSFEASTGTLSFEQNDAASGEDDETLSFKSLTSSSSMK